MATNPSGSAAPQGGKTTRRGSRDTDNHESDRQMSLTTSNSKSMSLRNQPTDFDHQRWLFESKGRYGIGNAYWQDEDNVNRETGTSLADFADKPWKPLTRKTPVPASVLSPYRCKLIHC